MTGHHVGGRVANEQYIDAGCVQNGGHGKVVSGEHGDLLAALFHVMQLVGGNYLNVAFLN